jgi:subtilisin family serine protease
LCIDYIVFDKGDVMKLKHVMLRTTAGATRDVFLGIESLPRATGAAAEDLSVEVDEIDRHEIPRLARSPGMLAIAPAIPMKLVAPMDIQDPAQPAADGVAWGVKAVGADTSPFSGRGIVVAVLDTGIDAAHPAFAGVTLMEEDFTGEGNGDAHGHGTHCAGIIFGRNVDGLRIGVAPGVSKALIGKVLGARGGSSDRIVQAMQWALDNGANIISMSLGMDFPGYVKELEHAGFPTEVATSRALEGYRANVQLFERLAAFIRAREAFGQPTITVAAAGNESRRDENPDFEIAVSPPAVAEGVISVGALGEGDQGMTLASFSNTGTTVCGPGVRITSAKRGGGLVAMSGTSMATPHVAGVAALWAQKFKTTSVLNAQYLMAKLVASGSTDGLQPGLDLFDIGAGLVHAPQQ